MEEKRYPEVDEEQGFDMCCESVLEPVQDYETVMTRRLDGAVEVHDWIDDLNWNRFPILGPKTKAEAIARIEQAEKDLDDPTKWITVDDLHAELKKLHSWL